MAVRKKAFVLDTNVILHDSSCIHRFEEHDVIVPITVIEELDRFKKGNDSLNFHAREFARTLDSLSGDKLFNGGVPIAPGCGKISIKLEQQMHADLAANFAPGKPDHHILNAAYHFAKANPRRPVILVTKDVNLRMKAKAVGLMAQDYKSDHVKDVSALYTGHRLIENPADEVFDELLGERAATDAANLRAEPPFKANEFMIVRAGRRSGLGCFDPEQQRVYRIQKETAFGIVPRNAEQTFALHALLKSSVKLVSLSGKAGTGKTLLALAAALRQKKRYQQIVMARPVVPLSNKDTGFLPGDINAKLAPYTQPLLDNLSVIKTQFAQSDTRRHGIDQMLADNQLVIAPLSYIRGRTLVKSFFIVDEAQNLTPHEIKTIITRAGDGTKVVFTGDIFQIDHPYLDTHSNGLSYLIERMQGEPLYAHVNLRRTERSDLAELASNRL